jgi:quercetin dioxygenase-like cupin family protein
MGPIFHIDPDELPWAGYENGDIRFKALTAGTRGAPPVQLIEYGPGQTDPVHRHDIGELFLVSTGEIWLDEVRVGPGAIVFVPPGTDYAVRAGPEGSRYYRIVTGAVR